MGRIISFWCMCICIWIACNFEGPGEYLNGPSVRLEGGVVAVPNQGPAHSQLLQDWPDNLHHALVMKESDSLSHGPAENPGRV